MSPAKPDARAALQAGIRRIWENARGVVSARLDVLDQLAQARAENSLTPEQHQTAEREAHKLAGALGTFGFAAGSLAARELEQHLTASQSADATRWSELLRAIRSDLERGPTEPPDGGHISVRANRPVLLVHQPDASFAEALAFDTEPLGLEVLISRNVHELRLALARDPAAAVIDPWLDAPDTLGLLRDFTARKPDAAVIALTDRDQLRDRVAAARSGVRAFLSRPQAARDVAAQLYELMPGIAAQPPSVLVIANDASVRTAVADAMGEAGFRLTVVDDALKLWDAIAEARPDLLVLDADTRDISGVELCGVIRSDLRWRGVPVLVLTASADAEVMRDVFAAGADDVLEKSAIRDALSRRIRQRLHRSELTRSQADTDFLTGVATRRRSEEAIGYLMSLAVRSKQPVSVALLDIDRFQRINHEYGHAAGDLCLRRFAGMLRQTFRGVDVIARWNGEEFVVGLYGMAAMDAVNRLGDLLDRLATVPVATVAGTAIHVTFSGGVAQYPQDGQSLDQLIRAGDQALDRAKHEGRARVIPAGRTRTADQPDVMVIADDESVAQQILQPLETRGYRVQRPGDVKAALRSLTEHSLRPGLIILDADLRGHDGMAILRRLRQGNLLTDTRVIMLIQAAAEPKVLESLELDAFDHISKPIATSVLMQRVRRALA
ncbi:MAG: response regulator [Gemmatimonadota bacterium]